MKYPPPEQMVRDYIRGVNIESPDYPTPREPVRQAVKPSVYDGPDTPSIEWGWIVMGLGAVVAAIGAGGMVAWIIVHG